MTPEELEAIRERAEKATPGPWEAKMVHPFMDGRGQYRVGPSMPGGFQGTVFPGDAEFIAHAREDVPKLLAEVQRLHANLEQARDNALAVERMTGRSFVQVAPLFRLHASVEAIDFRLRKAKSARNKLDREIAQLEALRDRRMAQIEAGEWPPPPASAGEETKA